MSAEVLLADIDAPLRALIGEWLCEAGITTHDADAAAPGARLLLVELPFPRDSAAERLRDVAARWPGVRVLALSPAFFAGVHTQGAVARALGVAGVLGVPVSRAALVAAVHELLGITTP